MTSAGPSDGDDSRPISLSKDDTTDSAEPAPEPPFDPYRFGKPDVPPPPEYAPPGYVPDPPVQPSGPPPGGAYPPMPQGGGYGSPPPAGYSPQPPAGPPSYGQPYGQPSYGQTPYEQQQAPQHPQPYGQPPYGAPNYGQQYPGYGAPQGNGKAIAGMVLGIASIVFCWLTFFDLVLIVPALIFSLLGLSAAKERGRGRGQAIAGLICTGVGVVLAVVVIVVVVHLVHDCSGIDSGSSAYNRCLENHL